MKKNPKILEDLEENLVLDFVKVVMVVCLQVGQCNLDNLSLKNFKHSFEKHEVLIT